MDSCHVASVAITIDTIFYAWISGLEEQRKLLYNARHCHVIIMILP